MQVIHSIKQFLGVDSRRLSAVEKFLSGLGGVLGILVVLLTSSWFVSGNALYSVVASMGASAVLLFAVPHGPLSQPWALIGGHFISALVGVSCSLLISNDFLAAPLAVGLAIAAMHVFRCIHPPGGATALMAVVGGSAITDLGYGYVWTPVMVNVVAILTTAVLYGLMVRRHLYPLAWVHAKQAEESSDGEDYQAIRHEDFVYALSRMDTILDVSEDDLLRIYELATNRRDGPGLDASELSPGACYSNGRRGRHWCIRQIIDWEPEDDSSDARLIYKIVDGHGGHVTRLVTQEEFAQWARYRVVRDHQGWVRRSDGKREVGGEQRPARHTD